MAYRTAELARLAHSAGFSTTETHRAMLDGAAILLANLASGAYGPMAKRDQTILLDLAAALELLQTKIGFIDGMPEGSA